MYISHESGITVGKQNEGKSTDFNMRGDGKF